MVMDSGRGLEVIFKVLLFAARRDMVVLKLFAPAARVCWALLTVIVVAESGAVEYVTTKV